MSFLKFSRDRRGYEHFYLVEPVTGRRGKTRQRILYWFRTPPNVKVGREPFDPQVRRALETQYPGVRFDWEQLRNTPIPSVEPEYWRERRRAERVVRRMQEDEDAQPADADSPPPEPAPNLVPQAAETPAADREPETLAAVPSAVDSNDGAARPRTGREGPMRLEGPGGPGSRRRRRRRRSQANPAAPGPPVPGEPNQTETPAGASTDGDEVTEDGPIDSLDD